MQAPRGPSLLFPNMFPDVPVSPRNSLPSILSLLVLVSALSLVVLSLTVMLSSSVLVLSMLLLLNADRYREARRAAMALQALARMKQARALVARQQVSAVKMQATWRGWRQREGRKRCEDLSRWDKVVVASLRAQDCRHGSGGNGKRGPKR